MIAVLGEALIDLVIDHSGKVTVRPGGGPFNTARTLGRLGTSPTFLGRLSSDGFGRLLRERLSQDCVSLGIPELADAPTTLATADVDAVGIAHYRFYLMETAAAAVAYPMLSATIPSDVHAVHTGALALVMEPVAAAIERLIAHDLPPGTLLMVDPNCRPGAITDQRGYMARLRRILSRADVIKASVEDLAYLAPYVPAHEAAEGMLDDGAALVLITDGPRPARAFMPGIEMKSNVPRVHVVDTIGAGDAFGGAFLAWWSRHQLTRDDLKRPELVGKALQAAADVASLTCTRPGADPPWLAEIAGHSSWAASTPDDRS